MRGGRRGSAVAAGAESGHSGGASGPIVHIGYHKTATTWFQKALYPAVRNYRHVSRAAATEAFLDPAAFQFDPATARAALARGDDGRPMILCEEGLSGYIHNGGMAGHLSKAVAERIRAALPDARIVIFVRRQQGMIAACYQQYLRGGGTFSARRYLFHEDYLEGAIAQRHKGPRFCFEHFDYVHLARHYAALFGAENVRVYPYEAMREEADFAARYARELGLDVDLDAISLKRRNASYSPVVSFIARLLNVFTYRTVMDKWKAVHIPFWYPARGVFLEALSKSGLFGKRATPEQILGRRTVAWIEQYYWQGNAALAAEFGLDLARHRYPLTPPAAPVERPRRATWKRWTAI